MINQGDRLISITDNPPSAGQGRILLALNDVTTSTSCQSDESGVSICSSTETADGVSAMTTAADVVLSQQENTLSAERLFLEREIESFAKIYGLSPDEAKHIKGIETDMDAIFIANYQMPQVTFSGPNAGELQALYNSYVVAADLYALANVILVSPKNAASVPMASAALSQNLAAVAAKAQAVAAEIIVQTSTVQGVSSAQQANLLSLAVQNVQLAQSATVSSTYASVIAASGGNSVDANLNTAYSSSSQLGTAITDSAIAALTNSATNALIASATNNTLTGANVLTTLNTITQLFTPSVVPTSTSTPPAEDPPPPPPPAPPPTPPPPGPPVTVIFTGSSGQTYSYADGAGQSTVGPNDPGSGLYFDGTAGHITLTLGQGEEEFDVLLVGANDVYLMDNAAQQAASQVIYMYFPEAAGGWGPGQVPHIGMSFDSTYLTIPNSSQIIFSPDLAVDGIRIRDVVSGTYDYAHTVMDLVHPTDVETPAGRYNPVPSDDFTVVDTITHGLNNYTTHFLLSTADDPALWKLYFTPYTDAPNRDQYNVFLANIEHIDNVVPTAEHFWISNIVDDSTFNNTTTTPPPTPVTWQTAVTATLFADTSIDFTDGHGNSTVSAPGGVLYVDAQAGENTVLLGNGEDEFDVVLVSAGDTVTLGSDTGQLTYAFVPLAYTSNQPVINNFNNSDPNMAQLILDPRNVKNTIKLENAVPGVYDTQHLALNLNDPSSNPVGTYNAVPSHSFLSTSSSGDLYSGPPLVFLQNNSNPNEGTLYFVNSGVAKAIVDINATAPFTAADIWMSQITSDDTLPNQPGQIVVLAAPNEGLAYDGDGGNSSVSPGIPNGGLYVDGTAGGVSLQLGFGDDEFDVFIAGAGDYIANTNLGAQAASQVIYTYFPEAQASNWSANEAPYFLNLTFDSSYLTHANAMQLVLSPDIQVDGVRLRDVITGVYDEQHTTLSLAHPTDTVNPSGTYNTIPGDLITILPFNSGFTYTDALNSYSTPLFLAIDPNQQFELYLLGYSPYADSTNRNNYNQVLAQIELPSNTDPLPTAANFWISDIFSSSGFNDTVKTLPQPVTPLAPEIVWQFSDTSQTYTSTGIPNQQKYINASGGNINLILANDTNEFDVVILGDNDSVSLGLGTDQSSYVYLPEIFGNAPTITHFNNTDPYQSRLILSPDNIQFANANQGVLPLYDYVPYMGVGTYFTALNLAMSEGDNQTRTFTPVPSHLFQTYSSLALAQSSYLDEVFWFIENNNDPTNGSLYFVTHNFDDPPGVYSDFVKLVDISATAIFSARDIWVSNVSDFSSMPDAPSLYPTPAHTLVTGLLINGNGGAYSYDGDTNASSLPGPGAELFFSAASGTTLDGHVAGQNYSNGPYNLILAAGETEFDVVELGDGSIINIVARASDQVMYYYIPEMAGHFSTAPTISELPLIAEAHSTQFVISPNLEVHGIAVRDVISGTYDAAHTALSLAMPGGNPTGTYNPVSGGDFYVASSVTDGYNHATEPFFYVANHDANTPDQLYFSPYTVPVDRAAHSVLLMDIQLTDVNNIPTADNFWISDVIDSHTMS